MAGRWHAFLAPVSHEPRVVLMTLSQPWGHKTRLEALSYLRPHASTLRMRACKEAELLNASVNAIDVLMAQEKSS